MRYTDWFFDFAREVVTAIEKLPPTSYVSKTKLAAATQVIEIEEKFKERVADCKQQDERAKSEAKEGDYSGYQDISLVNIVEGIIDHYPPAYIV